MAAGPEKLLIPWINDGMIAIFFLIGLELKRELLDGRLKTPRDVVLAGMAAVVGMVLPPLFFLGQSWGNPVTVGGWASPAATEPALDGGALNKDARC